MIPSVCEHRDFAHTGSACNNTLIILAIILYVYILTLMWMCGNVGMWECRSNIGSMEPYGREMTNEKTFH